MSFLGVKGSQMALNAINIFYWQKDELSEYIIRFSVVFYGLEDIWMQTHPIFIIFSLFYGLIDQLRGVQSLSAFSMRCP